MNELAGARDPNNNLIRSVYGPSLLHAAGYGMLAPALPLFYPVGVVMDRWGRKWTIVPCLVLLVASMLCVPFTQGFASFLLAGLLGGFANGLGSGAVMTMGSDLAPRENSGEFLGVWRLISDSGAVLSPAIVGGLAQLLTLSAAFYGAATFGVAGTFVLVVFVGDGLYSAASRARADS